MSVVRLPRLRAGDVVRVPRDGGGVDRIAMLLEDQGETYGVLVLDGRLLCKEAGEVAELNGDFLSRVCLAEDGETLRTTTVELERTF